MGSSSKKLPLFSTSPAADPEGSVTEIESLCMNCQANGTTRLLLTNIPFFKEVIVASFTCDHCGWQNNELQPGGAINPHGVRIILRVHEEQDLNRRVVKSDFSSICIAELDFEIPAKTQKGEITTVEGILLRSINGLAQDQEARRIAHPEAAKKIDEFVAKLQDLRDFKKPFTLKLEDISGNSFIENPYAPQEDKHCKVVNFKRSMEQNHELGIYEDNDADGATVQKIDSYSSDSNLVDARDEVLQFGTNCPNCNSPCETNMKVTNIPYFKEVIIMATVCDVCGHKTNEVKSGGGIEAQGVRFEVLVRDRNDFSRDILKSETCSLKIPELDMTVGPYAISGRFTTVEGIVVAIKEQLNNKNQSFIFGDSVNDESNQRFQTFLDKIDKILAGKMTVTVVLDDPAGNSYVQQLEDDTGLKVEHYERSYEQNEELGLNDINTNNYG